MSIYYQDKEATPYIGYYKPVKVMRNSVMLAGYETSEKTGESLAWTDTYNDVIRSLSVEGKSTQAVTTEAITSQLAPYIIPFRYGAGAFDMSFSGMTNARWLYNGTIYTQARLQLTVADSVVYLLADGFTATAQVANSFVAQPYKGNLSDLQGKITYYLNLANCTQITGSLADLQGKITYYLNLDNCTLVTGSLADLQGKITYVLDLYNCTQITGSLADLQGKITYWLNLTNCTLVTGSLADLQGKITYVLELTNCTLVTGAYIPVGAGVPTLTYLDYTGISAADMDSTLIAYAATTKNSGTFRANGKTRTAASDAAVATLTGRGWAVSGLKKV